MADGAGTIDSFPGSSIWPFVMGMGAFMPVLGPRLRDLAGLHRHPADPHRADRRHRREPARRHTSEPQPDRAAGSLIRWPATRHRATADAHRRAARGRLVVAHRRGHRGGRGEPLLRAAPAAPGRRTFRSGPGATSTVITATQVGYAAGLLLIVPLGDLHPRRALVIRLFCVAAVALVACAARASLWFFALASVAVGGASVAGQVMIPFAADLAPEERRGRVVARIMTGLLLGILLARTVSGLVAQAGRLAGHLLVLGRASWSASRSSCGGPCPPRAPPAPQLRRAGRDVAAPARHRARAAPARLARRLRLRRLQRAVDHARLPALGQPVPLLRTPSSASSASSVRAAIVAANLAGKLADSDRHDRDHRRRRRPPGRLVRAAVGRPHLAGRPHHRHRRARHGHPGHADHQPGGDLRAAPRRPQPHQQRLHGLLLHRRRRRLGRRRRALRHATAGPASACSVPASAWPPWPCRPTSGCGRSRPAEVRHAGAATTP